MTQERRQMARYRFDAKIDVAGRDGRILDVSSGGVYFETDQQLVPGQEISLVLPFKYAVPAATLVTCTARVVRVDRRGDRFGVAAMYEPVAFDMPGVQIGVPDGSNPRHVNAPSPVPPVR